MSFLYNYFYFLPEFWYLLLFNSLEYISDPCFKDLYYPPLCQCQDQNISSRFDILFSTHIVKGVFVLTIFVTIFFALFLGFNCFCYHCIALRNKAAISNLFLLFLRAYLSLQVFLITLLIVVGLKLGGVMLKLCDVTKLYVYRYNKNDSRVSCMGVQGI